MENKQTFDFTCREQTFCYYAEEHLFPETDVLATSLHVRKVRSLFSGSFGTEVEHGTAGG